MLHFQVQHCLPGSLTYCADGEEGVLLDKRSKHCVTEQCHICFHCTKHSSSLTFPSDSRHKMMFSTNFYLLSLLHIKLHYFRLRKLLNHYKSLLESGRIDHQQLCGGPCSLQSSLHMSLC